MTYEADQAGVLAIVAQEGDTLPVGETIARIGEAPRTAASGGGEAEEPRRGGQPADEEDAAARRSRPQAAERRAGDADARSRGGAAGGGGARGGRERQRQSPRSAEPAPAPSGEPREGDGGGRVKASPVARRMARELGLELAALEGTGPGGRIVKADVEAAASGDGQAPRRTEAPAEAEAAPAEPRPRRSRREEPAPAAEKAEVPPPAVADEGQTGRGEVTHEDLSRLQQTVARRMAESKATAPEFVLTPRSTWRTAVELRKQLKAAAGDAPAPSYNDFVVKAARARAARVPARERRLPRREVRALLARQRRRGGGRPGRAPRPHRVRRRPQVARSDRAREPRARRARAGRRDHAARALGGDVHGLEPRDVRHHELHRGHQPAAGRDPRGRRDEPACRSCATAR